MESAAAHDRNLLIPLILGVVLLILGLLLRAIVIRSVLVTALTLDIGRHVWWPSALARPAGSVRASLALACRAR